MLIFAAILATFVYGMTSALFGTILPRLSERFQLTPRQNGLIAAAQGVGLMVASLSIGPLLDARGDKIGLLLGLAAIAIALFALPRAGGFIMPPRARARPSTASRSASRRPGSSRSASCAPAFTT